MGRNWLLPEVSLKNKKLYYKLNVLFGLFCLYPVLGFSYFIYKHNIQYDRYIMLFLALVLFFSLVGFVILRRLFDRITRISEEISGRAIMDYSGDLPDEDATELQKIVHSFNVIEERFREISVRLESRSSEISILKELSDICYVTLDPEEILYVTLERALTLTDSDVGSVLILDRTEPKSFVVKASIGLGELVKVGDRLDFDKSIAKYAVINKSPLVVSDIEKDTRFGRTNRSGYGTKSFICMPIKTIRNIIGVITISRKNNPEPYQNSDVDPLTPLLSNAAFTYENLHFLQQIEQGDLHWKSVGKIFGIIGSSLRGGELLQAIFTELQAVVPFGLALVLTRDENRSESVTVLDLQSRGETDLTAGSHYDCRDSIIDRVMRQETSLIVDDTEVLAGETERKIFLNQGYAAAFLTPLMSGGRVKGVLALAADNAAIFRKNKGFVEWLATGVALAIEQNRLATAVIKRDQEFETLKQIGAALASSTFDIQKVLKYTMDMIREVMSVEAGSLSLVEGSELEFAAGFNTDDRVDIESLKKFRLKLGQGIAGSVAARGETLIVNDTQKSNMFYQAVDESTGFHTRSVLCVPVISQSRVVGVIEVLNKRNSDFDDNDRDLLQSIASSVSIAIENARLYEETVLRAENERDIRQVFQKFVPKEVVEKIIHDTDKVRTAVDEFKTLTLLNIDMRGFSELTRQIGPQKTVSLLNYFFSVMGGIVFKHKGIVDKYLGDGFLALFGAPVSTSMDADNAVAAALAMQEALVSLNDHFMKELGTTVGIGISIHTGEVVVGNIGFEMKMDYTVIGDPVNTVFELQDMAKSFYNGILIGEDTLRAAQSRLEVREVKAILGDTRIYELLGKNTAD